MARIVREQVQVGRVITFGGLLTHSQRILDAAESKEALYWYQCAAFWRL
ncbi:hypothetical protein ACNKHT_21955 [Shigella flexneri]